MKRDHITAFFTRKFPLLPFSNNGLDEFSAAFKTQKYKKGSIISRSGETEKQLCFMEDGIVREFYSYQGKEMNTWFYLEHEFITDFRIMLDCGIRKKYQECLTDTTLKTMDHDTFFQFMEKYECGREFVYNAFKEIISLQEEEEFKHFSLSPDDLYFDLLANRPKWLQYIPLYHIATFLRMTPETLSRIRKRN